MKILETGKDRKEWSIEFLGDLIKRVRNDELLLQEHNVEYDYAYKSGFGLGSKPIEVDKKIGEIHTFNLCVPVVCDPDPKIIKSGDTWVAEYKGVDYLCVNHESFSPLALKDSKTDKEKLLKQFNIERDNLDYMYPNWKPISEIEITDEIAKLRPMMIHRSKTLIGQPSDIVLYGVTDSGYIGININNEVCISRTSCYRLSTVKDLEDC